MYGSLWARSSLGSKAVKRAMVGLIGGAVLSGVAAVAASGQNESAREIKA